MFSTNTAVDHIKRKKLVRAPPPCLIVISSVSWSSARTPRRTARGVALGLVGVGRVLLLLRVVVVPDISLRSVRGCQLVDGHLAKGALNVEYTEEPLMAKASCTAACHGSGYLVISSK